MEIVWDNPKRLANLDKHGMDFATLDLDFFAAAMVVPGHDGRYRAIGRHEGRAITVVFAPLGSEAISVISMRPASKNERSIL